MRDILISVLVENISLTQPRVPDHGVVAGLAAPNRQQLWNVASATCIREVCDTTGGWTH